MTCINVCLKNLFTILFCVFRTSQLTPTDFEILSEKICFAFPTETKETYYVPRVPALNKQKAVNARGKLIDKYRNFCRMYNTIREDASTAEESSTSIDDHDANSGNITLYQICYLMKII